MLLELLVMLMLLVGAVFFALVRSSFYHVSHHRLEKLAREQNALPLYQAHVERHAEMSLAAGALTILFQTALVVLIAVVSRQMLDPRSVGAAFVAAAVIAFPTVALLVQGSSEVLSRVYAEQVVLAVTPLMAAMGKVFVPLCHLAGSLEQFLRGTADRTEKEVSARTVTDEILSAVTRAEKSGALPDHEAKMIRRVIGLADIEVTEVMTPRTEIAGIPADHTIEQAVDLALDKGHSRLPVYQNSLDNIVGIANIKDLAHELRAGSGRPLTDVMRHPYFVPENKKVADLLRELQSQKLSTAVVLDEYGGTAGLVTLEDIVEEVVGEIEDEHDWRPMTHLVHTDADTVEVTSRCPLEELNEALHLELPVSSEYDTVTGYALHVLGRIPQRGEEFESHGARFQVLEANARSVRCLKVTALPEPPEDFG